jgi:hypothetical protein
LVPHCIRNALLALTALPALFIAQRARAGDPVTDLAKRAKTIEKIKVKDVICDRKACKIYPSGDDYKCRLYRPKGGDYVYKGETLYAKAGAFQDVDCDTIIDRYEVVSE